MTTGKGPFTLLDTDSSDKEIDAAVRALLGLPDDYDIDGEDERDKDWDETQHPRGDDGKFLDIVHGTVPEHVENIRKQGLLPSSVTKVRSNWTISNEHDLRDAKNVFVTDSHNVAQVYGRRAALSGLKILSEKLEAPLQYAVVHLRVPKDVIAGWASDEDMQGMVESAWKASNIDPQYIQRTELYEIPAGTYLG